jgi:hypothetical protein
MSLQLDAPAPGDVATESTETPAEGSADPKVQSAAESTPDPAAAASTNTPAATSETKTEPSDTEERRAYRAAQSELAALRAKLQEIEASANRLKPYADLEEIAKKDPAQWIHEMAEAQGVSPQRVLELLTKRGAGEQAALTAEERVAKLERAWAEREAQWQREREENDRRSVETKAAEVRRNNVGAVAEFIKVNAAKEFPGLDERDADAVFQVVEARYNELPEHERPSDQARLRALYVDAAKRVEAAVRAEAERRAERFGYSKPQKVQTPAANEGFRGLSLSNTTAPASPHDFDRVNTPDDIDALVSKMFS